MHITELRAQRTKKVQQMREIIKRAEDENRLETAEEGAEFDKIDKEIEALDAQIERRKRIAADAPPPDAASVPAADEWRDAKTGTVIHAIPKGESFTNYVRRDSGLQVPEYGLGDLCRAIALGPQTDREKRALAEGTQSAGGFLVPVITSAQLIDAMRPLSACLTAGARLVNLENNQVTIARVETDPTASWRAEAAAIAESDPVFSAVSFVSRSLAFYFKCSRELLQDAVNLNQAIQAAVAGAMAKALDYGCLKGDGVAPNIKGVANVTGVGSYSMGANGLALADFSPFVQAVKLLLDANVPLANIGAFVMATRTFGQAALLKEATTNRPLDRPELIRNSAFIPTTLLPVNETQGTSSDCSRMVVGDWPQMLIGVRLPVTVSVLQERFAEVGQIAFLAFARFDMQLAHAGAFAQVIGLKA